MRITRAYLAAQYVALVAGVGLSIFSVAHESWWWAAGCISCSVIIALGTYSAHQLRKNEAYR